MTMQECATAVSSNSVPDLVAAEPATAARMAIDKANLPVQAR
jgi:hypothetical protein